MKIIKTIWNYFFGVQVSGVAEPVKTKTEYRIVNSSSCISDRALQFKHADGTWRYIHEHYVGLIREPLTQDNCPLRENGKCFTISGSEGKMKRFAERWPDIEDYMKYLYDIQCRGAIKEGERKQRPTTYL